MFATSLHNKILRWLNYILAFSGIASLISILAVTGFYLDASELNFFKVIIKIIVIFYIVQEVIQLILSKNVFNYLISRWFENILAVFLFFDLVFPDLFLNIFSNLLPHLNLLQITMIYLGIMLLGIILSVVTKALRHSEFISKLKLNPGAVFLISFAFIIITGTLLLLLPKAVPYGKTLSFVDALFTSTSAVCVTGLTTVDTSSSFTALGKFIIMLLIQVGGLGIMTLTTFFAVFLTGGVCYKVKLMMKDLLDQDSIGAASSLLFRITVFTLAIETVGALLLYLSLGGTFSNPNYSFIYTSVFHSVSAFCNAGFSLFKLNLMDVSTQYNYNFLAVIMSLIVLGGLGFPVLNNIATLNPFNRKSKRLRYQLTISSKIVIITTFCLIVSGTIIFFFSEPFSANNSMGFYERYLHSVFLSITARTAGFNSVPTELLATSSVFILILLMCIGGSSGSTAGGIKTATFSIIILTLWNLLKGKDKVEIFNRQIAEETIRKALIIVFTSISILFIGFMILLFLEPYKNPIDLLFEATSALGTVGLSRNLTFYLQTPSKYIIILLMFIGRIGTLTFLLSFAHLPIHYRYTLPKENVLIG